ncbi:MAG TPA: transketolase C-terminal domain-containing protein, partial [Parasegetibacter sp.]
QERLEWEREWDGLKKFREWIITNALASEEELSEIEKSAKEFVRKSKNNAWEKYIQPISRQAARTSEFLNSLIDEMPQNAELQQLVNEFHATREPLRRDVMRTLFMALEIAENSSLYPEILAYYNELKEENKKLFNSHLMEEGKRSALKVPAVPARIGPDAPVINGYEILNKYFDQLFASNPKVLAFGEDVGKIGDVNQGFAGLQEKYGVSRISDTGIRELTIMGQGLGLSLRGLRPIAEIQYLDYLLYGLQVLSDDVATTQFRTAGQQAAPLIVRTRGHRLEGIWHSGSPMGMIINSLRGMHVCVPRNMVQAIGMYNTLLQSNDPALMIECLNGYRLKETAPSNLLEFTVPLGKPEIIREGADITLVSYGSMLRIIMDAAKWLEKKGISCEVVDVQTLLPFDLDHDILKSLKKTNRILFIDEDVPGGAAAYMFTKVMEEQGGYRWLDCAPRTLTAQAHRPSYGSDGDYFSKPNAEDVIRVVSEMMKE